MAFFVVLGATAERFEWICHAYCLMTNHYHPLVETPNGNRTCETPDVFCPRTS